jgi:Tol biopolymer transport system component
LLEDNQHDPRVLTLASDLGDSLVPFFNVASITRETFSAFTQDAFGAMWTPGGRVAAVRGLKYLVPYKPGLEFVPKVVFSDTTNQRFLTQQVVVLDPGQLSSEDNPDVSFTGQYIAYEQKLQNSSRIVSQALRVAQIEPFTEVASFANAYYPAWSPVSNRVAFVTVGQLMEYSVSTGAPSVRYSVTSGGDIQWPAYRHDGDDIAFQVKTASSGWKVRLATGGETAPPVGFDDTRPVWSPDGRYVLFIRTERLTRSSQLMRWEVSTADVQALTNLPDHVVLGGAEKTCSKPFLSEPNRSFTCYPGRAVWVRIPQ